MIDDLKPYPAMKDSGVAWLGQVPAHWEVRRLKQICRMDYGDSLVADVRHDGSVPVFGSNGCVGFHDAANTKAPCVIVGRKGSFGKVHHSQVPAFAIDTTFFIDARATSAHIRWLFYLLGWLRLDEVTRDSAVPGLDREEAYQRPGPVPPPPEQATIVRYLDHADRRIRRYIRAKERLIALLAEQRKQVTQETILSENCVTLRLEVVADLVERPVKRERNKSYTPVGLYNRGRGIFKKEPRLGGELGDSNFFWIERDDLVISGQFAWEGAIALADDAEHGCVSSHRYPILRGKRNVLNTGFLLSYFQSDWGQVLLDHHSRGAAGRNRPLNARTLMKEHISLPSLQSQMRVSEMLVRETQVRRQVKSWRRLLVEFRTRLIADVVTGKLDVREAADALPAEPDIADAVESDCFSAEGGDEDRPDHDRWTRAPAIQEEMTE